MCFCFPCVRETKISKTIHSGKPLCGAKTKIRLLLAPSSPNSKHWFTTAFLQPLLYIVTPKVPENCQLTSSFFVGAQTVVRLLQTTQIISDVCFITDHVAYASSNKTKIVWIETELFLFFLPGVDGRASCLRACLGARLLLQSYKYPNLSEGAERVGGQLRGDKDRVPLQWRN